MMKSILKQAVWTSALLGISFTPPASKNIIKNEDGGGLEAIIVETYYISDSLDATDTAGGYLAPGSVTYRIYVDMAPGYKLQTVYGYPEHPLSINTTTTFFNNKAYGQSSGCFINNSQLNKNTTALDSWIAFGAPCKLNMGILKAIDTTGTIVGGMNNDGGSAGIPGGLLRSEAAGIALTTADGLFPWSSTPMVSVTGTDLSPFDGPNNGQFIMAEGLWSYDLGVQGPTPENQVLIAQITTTGRLSFKLNVGLQSPNGEPEAYVAQNPIDGEIIFAELERN
jgi:hypothetical protein